MVDLGNDANYEVIVNFFCVIVVKILFVPFFVKSCSFAVRADI